MMRTFIQTLLNEGGPLVYVILACLVLTVVIFFERFLVLHRCRIDTYALLNGLTRQLKNKNLAVALANCDSNTGPIGEIFHSAIEHWGDGELGIRCAVEETANLAIRHLETRMKLLSAFASITPIFGLLGTLCKMIDVFSIIKNAGGEFVGTLPLAGSICGALICTAAGLVASLVAYVGYTYLTELIERIVREMHKGAMEITYFLTANPMQELFASAEENK